MPRPKEFDPEKALDSAVKTFWEAGYQKTSMEDLLRDMGINRGSFYDTYGNKRNLFLAAMDRYAETVLEGMRKELANSSSPKQGLCNVFNGLVEMEWGCFITSTAVELGLHDAKIAKVARSISLGMRQAVFDAVQRAQDLGEISQSLDARNVANILFSSAHGMMVLSKLFGSQATLREHADAALALLDS